MNKEHTKQPKKRRRFDPKFLILLIALGAVFFFWWRKNQQEDAAVEEIQLPVKIMKPVSGTIRKTFTISGYIETESMVTILPKISGTLTSLSVDIGDTVRKGQVIGEIDSEPYKLTLRQAEAAYLATKSTFERTEQLFKAQATSKQNYDQVKAQYDAAKSQYELAELNYQYTKVTSPISGAVLIKHADEGALVAPQVPIITVGDLGDLVVKAKVPEKYYTFFVKNKKTMIIDADLPAMSGTDISVTLKTIAPYISPETKTFEAVCKLGGKIDMLRPGMFITLSFVLDERRNVFYLPFQAIVGEQTLWYLDEKTSEAHQLQFTPSFYNETDFQVPDKYKAYSFIIEGQHFIEEGQKCRIIK